MDDNVEVLAMDAASTSFSETERVVLEASTGFIFGDFGEAGWKRVGGFSFGKLFAYAAWNP